MIQEIKAYYVIIVSSEFKELKRLGAKAGHGEAQDNASPSKDKKAHRTYYR